MMQAGAQTLQPASVRLTYHKEAQAWRSQSECWIQPTALSGWGWSYSFIADEATIKVDSRTIKVKAKSLDGKLLLPFHQIAEQVGAVTTWNEKTNSYEAFAELRVLKIRDGKISMDSTLPVQPIVSVAKNPRRIIIDLKGLRIGGVKPDVDSSVRVAQFAPDTVRIFVQAENEQEEGLLAATRSFKFDYTAPVVVSNPTPQGEVPKNPVVTVPPTTNTPPAVDTTPAQGITLYTNVGPMATVKETDKMATFTLALPQPLVKPPQFKRTSPNEFEIFLPKGRYVPPAEPLGSPSISEVTPVENEDGLTLKYRLSRPMGISFVAAVGAITINLVKPSVGDGKLAGKTVVVDPGHGGHDSGATAPDKSAYEKNLTLNISKLVAQELTEQGATVILTRQSDVYITLKERPDIANRNNADFFVSIHINSNKVNNKVSGSISFFHMKNPVGELLATCIETEIAKVSKLPSMGVWSDSRIYKNDGFAVLRNAKVPAVLLELGFINHNNDRARLVTAEYQSSVAKAIVKGLKVYLGDGK